MFIVLINLLNSIIIIIIILIFHCFPEKKTSLTEKQDKKLQGTD